ncbi:LGFP repeat-containing protein [Nocardia sp. BSTN01]|uniref:LGFP repeat-containing protein n=1 Tax=Nocardia sp. BSTN01 TaxID=2783665 RepID=UPI001E526B8B|nr:hypothetical protein [Nocardia sp. BSTN01]
MAWSGRRQSRRSTRRAGLRTAAAAAAALAALTGTGAGLAAARPVGAFDVGGAIEKEYDRAGGTAVLGNPTGPESDANGGKFQVFDRGCSVYWSVGTDAHAICGLIRDKWGSMGWENSPLGFPLTDEAKAGKDGKGRFTRFPGGVIMWSANTGAHPVWGSILGMWEGSNADGGRYGLPTSDEYDYNGGKAQDFQGGRITWTP